jgi:glycyl-tRNA synthetase alpha subunit
MATAEPQSRLRVNSPEAFRAVYLISRRRAFPARARYCGMPESTQR